MSTGVSPSAGDWARLRALPAETILEVIGARQVGEHYACPRCPALFEIYDDASYGVSIRCTGARCRFGAWCWPEHAVAELTGCSLESARARLLTTVNTRPAGAKEERIEPRAADAEEEWVRVFYRTAGS